MACAEMKYSHERWHLWVFIGSIAMYPTIRMYDYQVFDNMSEKQNFIIKKPVACSNSRHCWAGQNNNNEGELRPQQGTVR